MVDLHSSSEFPPVKRRVHAQAHPAPPDAASSEVAPERLDPRALMARIEAGDQAALAELYAHFARPVYSLAYRVLQNHTLAEEATQDTFMKVWRQSARWDSARGALASWILTIARYTAIDRLRQENRQAAPNSLSLDTADAPPLADPQAASTPGDGALLRAMLAQIPPEQAQVIELGFFGGLTHQELAERLNQPLGTIKTRVRLGLQKLRALWQEAERGEPLPARAQPDEGGA
jgi:RNA polymerase sigma-70 factor (ECF subfamily)